MKTRQFLSTLIVLALAVAPGRAQFVRPPVIIPRAPVIVPRPPVHVPVHVPVPHGVGHGAQGIAGHAQREDRDLGFIFWIIGVVLATCVGLGLLVYWRKRSTRRAVIRITQVPPGEAPEVVRRAWIGLELPLLAGQVRPDRGLALGVLSGRRVPAPDSYPVDGRTAINLLAAVSPDAAQWWRQHAPHVLARGYQLVFPAAVCERLDDLGA
jgi:hypothetical protein